MRRFLLAIVPLLALVLGMFVQVAGPASAATLKEVTGFGPNPSNLKMYVYVPDNLQPKPPVVVALHWCNGDATAMYNGTEYARLADRYGYVAVYPSVTQASDHCFDVGSAESLTHGGGSDTLGVTSMVKYVIEQHGADPSKVFATGISGGAMMTSALLGAYPDVFAAGAGFAGVPFACFAPYHWNVDCAQGRITKTAREWGDLVRAAYPGYTGPRPRVQLWHGTQDDVLSYVNFGEQIKQFTDVHGISQTPTSTDTPQSGQTRTRYADPSGKVLVEAVSLAGVGHSLPVNAAEAIRFFGIDTLTPTPTPTPTDPGGTNCVVTIASQWQGGFVASVKVYPAGAVASWAVTLTLPNATMTNLWNGQATTTGTTTRVTNASWNGTIPAGQYAEFGFQATGSPEGLTCKI